MSLQKVAFIWHWIGHKIFRVPAGLGSIKQNVLPSSSCSCPCPFPIQMSACCPLPDCDLAGTSLHTCLSPSSPGRTLRGVLHCCSSYTPFLSWASKSVSLQGLKSLPSLSPFSSLSLSHQPSTCAHTVLRCWFRHFALLCSKHLA